MVRNNEPRLSTARNLSELNRELRDLKEQMDGLLEIFPELKTFSPRRFFDPNFHPLLDGLWTDEQRAFMVLKTRMAAVSLELSRGNDSPNKRRPVLRTTSKPEINKRITVILQNHDKSAPKICEALDGEDVSLPGGKGWDQVNNWRDAYKLPQLRKRIDTLISKAKRDS